jgi:transmembrane sensor
MKPTSEVIDELTLAEASAWLTRLQDSGRTPSAEAAFKEWLSASPAHARAFTRVNDVWELIPGAAAPMPVARAARHHRARVKHAPWLTAAACVAALLLVTAGVVRIFLPLEQQHVYQTAIGAQRTVVLDDNTRITLNTDTRMAVEYRQGERRVVLERGEALFHVTENPRRPFIVQTGDAQIVDLGTVFDVRHDSRRVAVTLLEGKVWVGTRAAPGQSTPATVLVPGERLTIAADGARVLDRPNLQEATAWRYGQIYFNDTTLSEAVAEINRYGGGHVYIEDPALAKLRVSGVFSVRDPAQFASAVASLHDLHATRKNGVIVLDR